MWEWKDFFLTCPLFDFDFELRFSWSSERRWESGGIGSKAVKKCRYNADPTLGVLYGKSIYTFLHFYTSPMRTFVNMQNRFGDFRSNPDCLM